MEQVRQLPAQEKRVETGAIKFGDDWPGLFIRGDEAHDLMLQLDSAISLLSGLCYAAELKRVTTVLRDLRNTIKTDVIAQSSVLGADAPESG